MQRPKTDTAKMVALESCSEGTFLATRSRKPVSVGRSGLVIDAATSNTNAVATPFAVTASLGTRRLESSELRRLQRPGFSWSIPTRRRQDECAMCKHILSIEPMPSAFGVLAGCLGVASVRSIDDRAKLVNRTPG
ncbi:hypothetical protein LIA77_07697 [Sarocladium implicatum]|nr:hypothetical protein LIA77_07697 [Sarocladium implicatum]